MAEKNNEDQNNTFYCSFVSIHYIICECGETFPSEEDLKQHLEREHATKKERKEFKCGACEAIFPTEEACIQHYELSHVVIKQEHDYVEDEPAYVEADVVITNEDVDHTEIQDYAVETNAVTEYLENETTYTKTDKRIRDRKSNYNVKNIVYEVGGKRYTSETYAKPEAHKSRVVKEEHDYVEADVIETFEGEGDEIHEYQVLSNDDSEFLVEEHTKTDKTKRERKPKSYYYVKNIVCEVCGKRYASNAALRYHQRVHTGERPYKCSVCEKSFTMPLFLQLHIRTHTGERPYDCPLCPKAFSNKAALLRHDRVHTGAKPYACPKCGKTFTQSNSMKLHVKTVHLKQPAPYKSKTRRIRSQEKDMRRHAILQLPDSAVEGITAEQQDLTGTTIFVKPEITDLYQQVEETEIMYDDVDSREITYEVIYEE